ncbi:ABC transporter permease [Biomaibacter acetigenes]|uniref:ABC transporter permease n=1 Tax=Biomaibacter acetigenes TaxID=2316383 RepID=A0A3G2R687_9FIRM|nr:ABC transporter permease [Biomaibacter acetigenes]AYO30921.1 ABC transporter permease [Biomaibacter acetigenes]
MKRYINTVDKIIPVMFFIFIVVAWELAVRLSHIEPFILPAPSAIAKAFFKILPIMLKHTKVTVYESFIGFTSSIAIAFVMAFVMDSLPLVKKALYPLVVVSQTIPTISVAPLFIIWFGYGLLPKIIVVQLVCFFPVLVSLLEGLSSVDPELLDLLRSMGADRWRIFEMVKLPAAMPAFFSGLKIAASYSILGAVIGEWLGAREGLGVFMLLSQHSFYVDRVFAIIAVISLLSLGVFGAINVSERLLIPWNYIKGDEWD